MMEDEKVQFGGMDIDLQEFIKPEYLVSNPMHDISLPSTTERKIAAHKRECTCLAFNPLGDVIATGGGDNLIKLWSMQNGKEIQELRGFSKSITDVAISLDNEYLVGSSLENKA